MWLTRAPDSKSGTCWTAQPPERSAIFPARPDFSLAGIVAVELLFALLSTRLDLPLELEIVSLHAHSIFAFGRGDGPGSGSFPPLRSGAIKAERIFPRPLPMQSINPEINAIHAAYCEATTFELPMMPHFERQWYEALQCGMTPDCVKLVVKSRMRRVAEKVRQPESLLLRNFCGSETAIADVICEAAAIRAKMRVKVYSTGKADVLRATGRPDQPEQGKTVSVKEVIQGMRSAVG